MTKRGKDPDAGRQDEATATSGEQALGQTEAPAKQPRLEIGNHQILVHNHGHVYTSDALRSLFEAWTEEQAAKSSGNRSCGDGIGPALELVRKFLSTAGTPQWNEWVIGHIHYAADRQVAHTFSSSQSQYDQATAVNKLRLNQQSFDTMVSELQSWADEQGTGMLRFWLDEESAAILAQCPNDYLFWHLLHHVSFQGWPVQAYFMKHAVRDLRNEFLLKSLNTFGRPLPLSELWLLLELKGDQQAEILLKTLSVAELCFCFSEGALCWKSPGAEPKNQPSVVFNPLFLTTASPNL